MKRAAPDLTEDKVGGNARVNKQSVCTWRIA